MKSSHALNLRYQSLETAELIGTLAQNLKKFLPLDKAPGDRTRVSFAALATHLGLRGWRKSGFSHQSLERLLFLALDRGPEALGCLVRMAVKRGTRYRRNRQDWCRKRWDPSSTKQPVWRESVEEIISLLHAAKIPARDLDEKFVRCLPSCRGWLARS
jgi:hypothetical protein